MKNKPVILVTGASGQLGKTLQAEALDQTKYQWFFYTKKELDITNPTQVETIFEQLQPDFCINTAAYTNVNKAEEEKEKAHLVNATAVAHLASVASQHTTRLIHLSTDYVFDGEQSIPYTEDDIPNPLNEYGKSKATGETQVLKHPQHYVVRTAWLYAKNHGHNFYRTIVKKAKAGEILSIVNDQVGSPTSTDFLAHFLLCLIDKSPQGGIYHCAGEKVQSWYSFAKDILREQQLEVPIQEAHTQKTTALRPRFSALSATKTL